MRSEQLHLEGVQRKPVGRRRYVTVLFADVCGSSEHAERLDAEEYAELLWRFRTYAREIIPRHGGSIARLQGDGLLALFGHLESREDDGRRAVEAALELHAAVHQLEVGTGAQAQPMQLHSGIHAGLVLLIEGDIELGRYDVVGEVPNTAARLCSLAGYGEVLVSAETLGPLAQAFTTTALGNVHPRGRREPLQVLRVSGRVAVARRIDAAASAGRVAFIGRDEAMVDLSEAARRALVGQGQVVVLRGEPGIGKTRALDEFVASEAGAALNWLRGHCSDDLNAEPLQPFLQMLRSALGWRTGVTAEANAAAAEDAVLRLGGQAAVPKLQAWAHRLLGVGGQADAAPGQSAVAAAEAALLELLRREEPEAGKRAVVIEDWHWADEASRALLARLRAALPGLLWLVTSRPLAEEDPALAQARLVDLQPLSAEDTHRAIAAWLPDATHFLVQEILQQSGGSPLFIEELCHAAAAGRKLHAAAHSTGVAWINALVASRVDALAADQAEALRVAAVVGPTIEPWVLERLLGAQQASQACADLTAVDFLAPALGGQLRFKHVLTRNAVYATVPLQRRRELHARVAQLLLAQAEGGPPDHHLEALSYHFDAAALPLQAAQFAEAAGHKALSAMALDRARMQYSTALRALDALPELARAQQLRWCAIAQKLGQTCVFDALDVNAHLPAFERAAVLAGQTGDDNALARAHYWLGYVYYGKGQPRRSVEHCRTALRHAQASGDERLAAQVLATLGQALASAGRYAESLPLMAQAVHNKQGSTRAGSPSAIGSAYALARTGYTRADIGEFEAAGECFSESLRLLGDQVHPVRASVLEVYGAALLWQGRWVEAQAAAQAGTDLALRCRSQFNTEMGRALAAYAQWASAPSVEALQALRAATTWIEEHGGAISMSLCHGALVEVCVHHGLYSEAQIHASRLLARARAQDRQGAAQGLRALAWMAVRQGDRQHAERLLRAADRLAHARGSRRELAMNEWARARVASQAGDAARAAAHAQAAHQAFVGMQMAAHAALAKAMLAG